MAKLEILAPAGGQEQLVAAVRCGADAVYLGGGGFNARRNAENFGGGAMADAAAYCHVRGVRLCAALNTVALDHELPALEAEAEAIAMAGADAVILQDMAAARLFAIRFPHIRRIASTQTAVHSADGVRFLEDAGFQSFVLARELSLDEMADICAAARIPAEAFVHGAHCMSVSGMCYLSAVLGGRSGNRGLCAQPCRLDWRCGTMDHALSLRDMSLVEHIRALGEAGVRTLKIEGRMKRPEYVAAAVTACRAARDGEAYDAEALRAVFSRGGFTDGYLTGRRDGAMFGHRTREDVADAAPVLKRLAALYQRERQSVPVSLVFSAGPSGSSLTVSDGRHTAAAAGPVPEPAVRHALDAESAKTNLAKTGGTPYYASSIRADVAPGLMLPASALNAMRRQALDRLSGLRAAVPPFPATEALYGEQTRPAPRLRKRDAEPSPLWARFYRADQAEEAEVPERIILPVDQIDPALAARLGDRLIGELPAVCFPADAAGLAARVTALRDAGLRALWTDNIYGITLGRRLGLAVHGGFGLNAANGPAAAFCAEQGLESLTLSFELPMAAVRALRADIPLGIAAYGRLPLMRYRNCPLRAGVGCAACGGGGMLTDRKGVVFPVECGGRRYSTLLNSVPLDIAGRDDPADFRLLWFTREERAECARVMERFLREETADAPHTGGLYYRRLL